MLVQSNRVGRDERVCQGPGESTLMEMTVLERDSRRVMARIQPPLCFPPVQTGCPPEPRLAQLNTALCRKHCICPDIITLWKSIILEKYQWWKSLNRLSAGTISNYLWLVNWLLPVYLKRWSEVVRWLLFFTFAEWLTLKGLRDMSFIWRQPIPLSPVSFCVAF